MGQKPRELYTTMTKEQKEVYERAIEWGKIGFQQIENNLLWGAFVNHEVKKEEDIKPKEFNHLYKFDMPMFDLQNQKPRFISTEHYTSFYKNNYYETPVDTFPLTKGQDDEQLPVAVYEPGVPISTIETNKDETENMELEKKAHVKTIKLNTIDQPTRSIRRSYSREDEEHDMFMENIRKMKEED